MAWEFHFRNFESTDKTVSVHAMGCAMTPWRDGRPKCWEHGVKARSVASGAVYVPSNFVVHFHEILTVFVDVVKISADVALFVASEGEDVGALVDAIADTLDLTKDVVKASLDKLTPAEQAALLKQARASLEQSCAKIHVDPAEIEKLARDMHLQPNWAFIAGDGYRKYIHDNSDLNLDHGWTVGFDATKGPALADGKRHVKVCNLGAFVAEFQVTWKGGATDWTDHFPVLQTQAIDLETAKVPKGVPLELHIHARAGKTVSAPLGVYHGKPEESGAALFEVSGTTLNVDVAKLAFANHVFLSGGKFYYAIDAHSAPALWLPGY
jgi:hypothetical protein